MTLKCLIQEVAGVFTILVKGKWWRRRHDTIFRWVNAPLISVNIHIYIHNFDAPTRILHFYLFYLLKFFLVLRSAVVRRGRQHSIIPTTTNNSCGRPLFIFWQTHSIKIIHNIIL